MARKDEPPASEITPLGAYVRRREFIKQAGAFGATALGLGGGLVALSGGGTPGGASALVPKPKPIPTFVRAPDPPTPPSSAFDDKPTAFDVVTTYNNFYEFGLAKTDPARRAHTLKPSPWTVLVEGEVKKPGAFDVDALLKGIAVEERVYRMRCVETWSMVIPWLGVPLGALLKRFEPTSRAKYVEFTTLFDAEQMPTQTSNVLPWPYVEGLRMDEAMHPLTLLAIGLYGKALPNQNGAPLRLVVPWKYGFKGIKSIVSIKLVEQQPKTTWPRVGGDQYGFFANVNPKVPHPRWSQATERRLPETERRPTLMFNGYADQVAGLYTGMDLRENF